MAGEIVKTREQIEEMIEDLNIEIKNSKSLVCKELYYRQALLWVLEDLFKED